MTAGRPHLVKIELLNADRLRAVEVGSLLELEIEVTCNAGCDLSGHSVIVDHGSGVSKLHELIGFDAKSQSTSANNIVVSAPDVVGESHATIRLPATTATGIHHQECVISFSIVTKPVATILMVWDVPRPIVGGEVFVIRFGLKSSLGLSLTGASISVFDADGRQVGSSAVGDRPTKNTTALYGTVIELTAPQDAGECTWSARTDFPAIKHPHEDSLLEIPLLVVSPPQYTLQICVTDDSGEVGIAGTILRLGPHQKTTNAHGFVEFHVSSGNYRLQSWHPDYELISQELVVAGNAVYHFATRAVSSDGSEFL